MKAVIGDLKNPPAVDQAVGRAEASVGHKDAVVQVDHAL